MKGKKTNQERSESEEDKEKKERLAYVPESFGETLEHITTSREKEEPLVPNRDGEFYTPDGVQERVRTIGKRAYEDTGINDFKSFSSHDLRRFFAHHNFVVKNRNPKVIMDQGGWSSFKAIEKYLGKVNPERKYRVMNDKDTKQGLIRR